MGGNYNNVVKLSTLRQAQGRPFDKLPSTSSGDTFDVLNWVERLYRPALSISVNGRKLFYEKGGDG
jgi:hypothetical protein